MIHSWHHHSHWADTHPYAHRKYLQRRRRDDLRDIGKLLLGAALWFGTATLVPLVVMWVWG